MSDHTFAYTVESILSSESLIRVKPVTPVLDASGLIQIVQLMAQKIEQQDSELIRQRDIIDTLVREVGALRTTAEDVNVMRRDMKRVINEVETLNVQQRMQNQRVDRLRSDTDDLMLEQHPTSQPPSAYSPPSVSAPAQQSSPQPLASRVPVQPTAHLSSPVSSTVNRGPSVSSVVSNQQRPVAGLELEDTVSGLRAVGVKPGGPACLAGMEVGDIIVAVNSEECPSKQHFLDLMERSSIGQPQDIAYYRQGAKRLTRLYLVSGAVEGRSPDRR